METLFPYLKLLPCLLTNVVLKWEIFKVLWSIYSSLKGYKNGWFKRFLL